MKTSASPGRSANCPPTAFPSPTAACSKSVRHEYADALQWAGFCGGPRPYCQWMERDQILAALAHFGFTRQTVRDEPNPHGSALSVVASRSLPGEVGSKAISQEDAEAAEPSV